VLQRVLAGLALAALISFGARRAGALSWSGAIAATIVGTLAVAAGWQWAALVVAYFATAAALSRHGRTTKERRTAAVVAKHGPRDARQVAANGGPFVLAALAVLVQPDARWVALGAGSLAASAADTWATEVGTLFGGTPRSILTWRPVPVGTSGGVSAIGSLAGLAGAAFIAALVLALGWSLAVALAVAIGGVAGAVADSVAGGSVQARRWCDACNRTTERSVHDCGAATRPVGGVRWIDNDMVNLLSGAVGGVLAAMLVH
jgi:uncharacterized protein (TIGR00297 family)